jgi:hypothetical protein
MLLKRITVKFVAGAILLAWTASAVAQTEWRPNCLTYATVVTLEGTLVRKTFAGPPHYRSIEGGDTPVSHMLLDLPAAACLNEAKPYWDPAQEEVLEIELVMTRKEYKQCKALLGRAVVVTGELSAIKLHPVTSVYLVVHSLKRKRMSDRR